MIGIFKYLNKIKTAVFVATLFGIIASVLIPGVQAVNGGGSELQDVLCGIIAAIATVIGVLAIFMFVLGGILYAFAHFLPAAGNLKGSMQGWGMGVLMGGIIMIILYVLAPFIVGTILGFSTIGSTNASLPSVGGATCASGA
jgi:hypothetical protein